MWLKDSFHCKFFPLKTAMWKLLLYSEELENGFQRTKSLPTIMLFMFTDKKLNNNNWTVFIWSKSKERNSIVWSQRCNRYVETIRQRGYGALYKRLIGQIQDQWLKSDQNIDFWLRIQEINLLHLIVEFWLHIGRVKLMNSCNWHITTKLVIIVKTGSLIAADRSNYTKINPDGLINYVVSKSLPVNFS